MITNVIIHMVNALPIVAALADLPAPGDRSIRCTNVRTVDGKRPNFVHDRHSTFVFPLSVVRLIEASAQGADIAEDLAGRTPQLALSPPVAIDEEPDEDLLARIRSV